MPLRFGTDGIRGVANRELTPELALALGRAAARRLPPGSFVLGADTRRSGSMLKGALGAGITAEGRDVLDVGVVPTPGLAWLAADRHLPAAMISASHNPFPDNGIKLLSPEGTKLSDALERAVEQELDELLALRGATSAATGAPVGRFVGTVKEEREAVERYAAHLLAAVALSPRRRLRVVCDCANGAASAVAPAVLRAAGAQVRVLAAAPDGTNINEGCGSTHPEALAAAVREERADLGLALDGDADRLIAIDHTGALVDGDHLIALFATDLAARGELEGGAVVVTVMSNLGLRRALGARGIEVVETPVGDRHVADALEANRLVLGGEQSGHIVFRRHATTGDGILTGLKLLELVSRDPDGRPLAELAAMAMTRLPQELRTVAVAAPGRLGEAASIWQEVTDIERALAGSGRVVLRASGTEPAIRVMVEAETHEDAAAAVDRLARVVSTELGAPTP